MDLRRLSAVIRWPLTVVLYMTCTALVILSAVFDPLDE